MKTLWRAFSTTVAWISRSQPEPTVPKWAVGAVVATPVAALIQGSILLHQYRKDHGSAPVPVTPSQGLVVVSSESVELLANPSSDAIGKTRCPPLRLLVVGDSLAAGVGISMSGTPVLPESIAKYLSQASGGRAVHWTCIGTPGASSTQIIHDLTNYDESHAQGEPSLLLQTWVEWEAATRRAQTWFQEKQRLQREDQEPLNNVTDDSDGQNPMKEWWQRLRKDAKELQKVISTKDEELERTLLKRRGVARRKTTFDPETMAQYDMAVVLTGLNDMKDAFLPFMMQGDNASATREAQERGSTNAAKDFKSQFTRIVQALQSKMKLDLSDKNSNAEAASSEDGSFDKDTSSRALIVAAERQGPNNNGPNNPMVVFPAMVTSPLPVFHHAPLSWFLVPLIRRMDYNKKLLAERYPGLVLYVDPPSISEVRAFEAGRGELHTTRQGEQVLLRLTDVTQRAQEKVKGLMQKHYKQKADEIPMQDQAEFRRREAFEQSCHDHHVDSSAKPGSTLVAADNVHPNDAGYDFWGRHIAKAIVNEWKQREDLFYAEP